MASAVPSSDILPAPNRANDLADLPTTLEDSGARVDLLRRSRRGRLIRHAIAMAIGFAGSAGLVYSVDALVDGPLAPWRIGLGGLGLLLILGGSALRRLERRYTAGDTAEHCDPLDLLVIRGTGLILMAGALIVL